MQQQRQQQQQSPRQQRRQSQGLFVLTPGDLCMQGMYVLNAGVA
jgi:hypothetical protein